MLQWTEKTKYYISTSPTRKGDRYSVAKVAREGKVRYVPYFNNDRLAPVSLDSDGAKAVCEKHYKDLKK